MDAPFLRYTGLGLTMTAYNRNNPSLAIRGADKRLWSWLKARAALEGKLMGELLSGLIEQYQKDSSYSFRRDYHKQLTIRGVDKEMWRWVKHRAAAEGKTTGEILNEMISHHKERVLASHKLEHENVLTMRGIDRVLWSWLKDRAAYEGKTVGQLSNEIIDRYREEVD